MGSSGGCAAHQGAQRCSLNASGEGLGQGAAGLGHFRRARGRLLRRCHRERFLAHWRFPASFTSQAGPTVAALLAEHPANVLRTLQKSGVQKVAEFSVEVRQPLWFYKAFVRLRRHSSARDSPTDYRLSVCLCRTSWC